MEDPENVVHVHLYKVEVTVMGDRLDECGFLVNVDRVAVSMEKALKQFEGKILNGMPEFRGITPSMENIAKVIWSRLAADLERPCVERIKVTVWEAEDICASFEEEC